MVILFFGLYVCIHVDQVVIVAAVTAEPVTKIVMETGVCVCVCVCVCDT